MACDLHSPVGPTSIAKGMVVNMKKMSEIMEYAKNLKPKTIAVAVAQDFEVLSAVSQAKRAGIANAILVGDKEKIEEIAGQNSILLSEFEIIDVKDVSESCLKAVSLVSEGKAHILLKGLVDTSIYLKAVLDKDVGLRTGNTLSSVGIAEIKGYDRLILFSDAAMNPTPDVKAKKQIIENTLTVAQALGIVDPKVGVLCSKEKVDPKVPSTIDAKELEDMNKRGEITGCNIAGPISLDIAVSREASTHKGYTNPVGGNADILIMPNLEAGNILYKSITYFSDTKSAGIIVGAKAPVIVTSRSDNDETKLNSIALSVLLADKFGSVTFLKRVV